MRGVSRTVTLVLVDPGGAPLGALAPYEVATPWWHEVAEVVDGARAHHGLDVTVLRLLGADRPQPHGGAVTYLAECAGRPAPAGLVETPVAPAGPLPGLDPHPLRAPWARPGGPAASVTWAVDALAALGRAPACAEQRRSWNLSALWRLHGPWGAAWLKQVPPFFAHEAAVLRWLGAVAPSRVPVLLAASAGRMLLAEVPGEDCHDAEAAERIGMLADLHTLQRQALRHADTLVALGVPDLRPRRLGARLREVAARHGAGLPALDALLADLPDRLASVAACKIPDTLVHGDFHPGNIRGCGSARVILDWGDCFVGHPAFDVLCMTEDLPEAVAAQVRQAWAVGWRSTVPGCDPDQALRLLAPVAALRNAAVYAAFVAAIEPAERPYHAADVGFWLHQAVAASA